MGKTILKAILRFFEGLLVGHLIFALLFVYVFHVPIESSTLGCIDMLTGTLFFFGTFWYDSYKINKNSNDKVYRGVEQIESQKGEPEPTVETAIKEETPKIMQVVNPAPEIICSKCGNVGLPKDRFCRKCGSSLK